MKSQELKKYKLPKAPGVYFFKEGKKILYIGKATSLRDRVKSYFSRDLIETRGMRLVDMVAKTDSIAFEETDSVLEALVLEAYLIKKYQPYYNAQEKDDKSFNYVVITDEDFPQVLLVRGKELELNKLKTKNHKLKTIYGPFTSGGSLKEALRIIRKIFPYFDKTCKSDSTRASVNHQIGLCPQLGISKRDYSRTIRNIKFFFEGRKKELVKKLEREMKTHAKDQEFEKAGGIKRTLFALGHIQDVSLIKNDFLGRNKMSLRIEAYDVAHMGGRDTVGVMVVSESGELQKSEYRKFKISKDKNDDIAGLKEILVRRLKHEEWTLPNIIVVDGGAPHKKAAESIVRSFFDSKDAPYVVAVTKDEKHRARNLVGEKNLITKHESAIIAVNAEAHRFAIAYHRKKRRIV
ncbi:hypothetical protein COB55_01320 [Candidatus Wolfebacteria bacterium]|nr:MAG: hypothetical protein COB55_01320 [Candidatus Wolfebacteria bacterium]